VTATIEVYLHPGEVYASARPAVVTTILGSCVAVCLSERGTGIGGVNHFLLAQQRAGETPSPRYGSAAIDMLINRVVSLGASRANLTAMIFGGANVLQAFQEGVRHIGMNNVDIARSVLARHHIPICAEDVGGTRGRRLVFSAIDGNASVRRLGS
jgi:chemotaxis protein CheD